MTDQSTCIVSDDITRRHGAQRLLQQLEQKFPDYNSLLSQVEPNGAVALRVMAKHSVETVILHVDAQRLADAHYVAEQIPYIREQLKRG